MAKKIKENSPIALELKKFESKINQFQDYLRDFTISDIVDDKQRHNEIDCQIKILNALPQWLAALEKLLEQEDVTEQIETRGDQEISGIMSKKLNNK